MKHTLAYLFLIALSVALFGCSEHPPAVRVFNGATAKANVQIKSSDGNTININDVQPNQWTGARETSEGVCEATAVIQDEPVSPTVTFNASNDHIYTVVIVNGNPPTLRVETVDR